MSFLSRVNKSEARKKAVEAILAHSEPVPEDHPAALAFQESCRSHGITRVPELRHAPVPVSTALVPENTILISELAYLTSPPNVIAGIASHEMAHIVFNDDKDITVKHESRADRFSHFLTGDPSGFAEHLKEYQTYKDADKEIFGKLGWKGKIINFAKGRQERKLYLPLEERLASLNKPITAEETVEFTQAIAAYNASQEIGTGMASNIRKGGPENIR